MRHRGRARQPAIADGPGDDPGRRVVGEVGRSAAGRFYRRRLLRPAQRNLDRLRRGLSASRPNHARSANRQDECPPKDRHRHIHLPDHCPIIRHPCGLPYPLIEQSGLRMSVVGVTPMA